MVVGIAAVIGLVVAALAVLGVGRRPRQDEGIQSFRRHIDALSPEARRDVHERARRRSAGRS